MRFRILGALVVCLLFSLPASAATVTLAWDRNVEPDVVGYQLEIGTQPGVYDRLVDVGNEAMWTVDNLRAGQTYYFAVRAYTADRTFSDPSAEISFTVTGPAEPLTYDTTTGTWSSPLHDQFGNTPANQPGWTVVTGDFNGDGAPDLLLYNPTTGAWLKAIDQQDGNYSFFGYTWAPGWTPTVVDFDGNGQSDLFLYNRTTGTWFVCLSGSGPDFSYTPGRWAPGWNVFPADFDGDGRGDLFLYNSNARNIDVNSGRWFRVLTQADGSFQYVEGDARWATDWQITPGDFDGDGRTDLFLYRPNGQWFKVFFTETSERYAGGVWAAGWTIRAGDFDGDGRSDLFLYNPVTGRWFVAVTLDEAGFGFYSGLWAPGWQIQTMDFDGDGRSDLELYNPATGGWFQARTLDTASFAFVSGTGAMGNSLTIVR